MIVTKKLWLDWNYDDNTPCDTLGWVSDEEFGVGPKRHNGIIEKGTELFLTDVQNKSRGEGGSFVTFQEVNEPFGGPEFTMEELFRFIKDGTFQLKDGK